MAAAITPEFAFLATAVRWPPVAARDLANAAAAGPLDWTLVVALARRHRVVALLAHALEGAAIGVPADAYAALAAETRQRSWTELLLAAEAQRLQTTLAAGGLASLLLKGAGLAIGAYGRLGVRSNRDIDLLIAPAAVADASALLAARGYERIEPAAAIDPRQLDRWLRRHKDIVFRHAGSGIVVELHWRLFDNPHLLPLSPAMRAPRRVTGAGGMAFDVLPTAIEPIYVCGHGAQHAWSRLKWLVDAHALLAPRPATELDALLVTARALGMDHALAQAMRLCHRLFGLPLSPRMARYAGRRARALERLALVAMVDTGAAELEDSRFGTTCKNVSHYLLASGPRYWLAEIGYDLTDTGDAASPGRFGAITRPATWLRRKLG